MDCPACGNQLLEMTAGGVTVDVCKGGCGGIWFDRFELQKLDEPHEAAGDELLGIDIDKSIVIDHDQRRKCPKCGDLIMMRHFFSVERQVEVDECPGCAGFWLDHGELGKIRHQYDSEEDRNAAAQAYFSDIFGSELEAIRKESKEKEEKANKIANIFRFICPSYYIPGKQDWGAF